jgi:hypothetical protein
VVKDYEIYDNYVVVILYDTTRVTIRPAQLSGGSLAYHKLLFLLHRMYTNEAAAELVNNLVVKLIQ